MRSDQRAFLKKELLTPQNVLALFSRYGFLPPSYTTVEKWFQRGKIPSAWLFVILAIMELEQGQPVSVSKYIA